MDFKELGTPGIQEYMGFVSAAYNAELRWPSVQPLYSRLRRSDPEISIIRQVYTALARGARIDWELPDKPSDGDKQAQEFAQSVTDDMAGGEGEFLETLASQVPFMGWGWWEVVPGLRDPGWMPPGEDDWRSEYDDGRIGIRRMAWRDTSSFFGWDISANGRVRGMVQSDFPHPTITLPIERSLHVTFGDTANPEGLSPLEAVWRLERIKYGLEVINGIGFEHSAGYLNVVAENGLNPSDKAEVQKAARAVMSAQEGNYAAWPKGVKGELKDVPFSAASAVLEAIRYYGIIKLQVFAMQWIAIASTAGTGAYSAASDASSMAVQIYNAMLDGFASQMDDQVGKRLFSWNSFPGMTRRPRLIIMPVEKQIPLSELAAILTPLKDVMPLGDEDYIAIRRKTTFLPETLPETGDQTAQPAAEAPPPADKQTGNPEPGQAAAAMAERQHYWQGWLLEHPQTVDGHKNGVKIE